MARADSHAKDPFRDCGIRHFAAKYGLEAEALTDPLDRISPPGGEPEERIVSWEDSSCGRVPMFSEGGDLFHAIGRILAGFLERLPEESRREIAQIPLVDIYEEILLSALERDLGKKIVPAPFWPDAKRFALVITHDVDEIRKTYQYVTRPLMSLKRGKVSQALTSIAPGSRKADPYWTFGELTQIEESLGVRSSLYFLQEDEPVRASRPGTWKHYPRKYRFSDPKVAGIIKELHAGGWEVGLHGSLYSYLSKELLSSQKEDLERALGAPVSGTRQHHLNLKKPDTWKFHEETGLSYDTSLGFKDDNGFCWGTCFPFHPVDGASGKELSVMELPLAYMDTTMFHEQEKALGRITSLMETVASRGGMLNVLFHHAVYNEREYPGWAQTFRDMVSACREKGAWIATAAEADAWWRARIKKADAKII